MYSLWHFLLHLSYPIYCNLTPYLPNLRAPYLLPIFYLTLRHFFLNRLPYLLKSSLLPFADTLEVDLTGTLMKMSNPTSCQPSSRNVSVIQVRKIIAKSIDTSELPLTVGRFYKHLNPSQSDVNIGVYAALIQDALPILKGKAYTAKKTAAECDVIIFLSFVGPISDPLVSRLMVRVNYSSKDSWSSQGSGLPYSNSIGSSSALVNRRSESGKPTSYSTRT